jgi:hypothetical protein
VHPLSSRLAGRPHPGKRRATEEGFNDRYRYWPYCERHIIPLIGTRRAKDLTKTDINKVLKDIMAGKTRVSVKTKKLRGKAIVRGGFGVPQVGPVRGRGGRSKGRE